MVGAVVSGRTRVNVVPLRSAATRIGTCSLESPRFCATPLPLRQPVRLGEPCLKDFALHHRLPQLFAGAQQNQSCLANAN